MDSTKKLSQLLATAKKYWNEPPEDCYVPYKEVVNLGIAGMGVNWTTILASAITLDAGSFLVGACIGLRPIDLQIMLIVANLIGIPIGLFRSWYYDNHHMKGGKFIPFLLHSAFPIFFISTVFVWLPFDSFSYVVKAIVVEVLYLLLNVFLCFYNESYAFLQQIISPNAQERATVMSISQIIFSFAPTVANFIIPTIAGLTYGMNNIWTYRVIYPAFTIIGLIINAVFFRRVKERLILPKRKVEYTDMIDAIREVSKNKYFWIINSASWIGFLEGAYGVILGWSFVYADGGSKQAQLGLANTIIGNAALWSMLLAPFAIKKFGKRNLLIYCNFMNVVLFLLLLPTYKNIYIVCVILYINGFINTFSNIYTPNINADMRDYHQWKTGVRVDGLFGPLGMIGTVLGMFTGLVIPAIYEKMGLHDDYDVLYDDNLRNNLFRVLIISSIIGAVLNLIPYLFYDLTESKHRGYINVLKIRAMFEDFGNGELDDRELFDGMKIINNARKYDGKEPEKIDKSALRAARRLPKKTKDQKSSRKQAIKAEKEKIKEVKHKNEIIESLPIVLEELHKFETERYKIQLKNAQNDILNGEIYYNDAVNDMMREAKALEKRTPEQREIRSDAINRARTAKQANKLIEKHGESNLKYLGEDVKNEIENRETNTLLKAFKARRDLKKYVKNNSAYFRASAPYRNAKLVLTQAENYLHLDEIESIYDERVAAVEK